MAANQNDKKKVLLLTWNEFFGDRIARQISVQRAGGASLDVTSVPVLTDGTGENVSSTRLRQVVSMGDGMYDAVTIVLQLPMRSTTDSDKFFRLIYGLLPNDILKKNTIVLFTGVGREFPNEEEFETQYLRKERIAHPSNKLSPTGLADRCHRWMLFESEKQQHISRLLAEVSTMRRTKVVKPSKGLYAVICLLLLIVAVLVYCHHADITISQLFSGETNTDNGETFKPVDPRLPYKQRMKELSDQVDPLRYKAVSAKDELYKVYNQIHIALNKQNSLHKNVSDQRNKTLAQAERCEKMSAKVDRYEGYVELKQKHPELESLFKVIFDKVDRRETAIPEPWTDAHVTACETALYFKWLLQEKMKALPYKTKSIERKCPKNPRGKLRYYEEIIKGFKILAKYHTDYIEKLQKHAEDYKQIKENDLKHEKELSAFFGFLKEESKRQMDNI